MKTIIKDTALFFLFLLVTSILFQFLKLMAGFGFTPQDAQGVVSSLLWGPLGYFFGRRER